MSEPIYDYEDMCSDQLDKERADNQIETAVAEGVEAMPTAPPDLSKSYNDWADSPLGWWAWGPAFTFTPKGWYVNRHPLTDVAAAMEALETLPPEKYAWRTGRDTNGAYYCEIISQTVLLSFREKADSPARAICLVLVALGEWEAKNENS